uniref:Uncharacterized protein n=1 Tax=Coturnix japonica TaxID=93934 RepID=A0A8C2T416_COTJA
AEGQQRSAGAAAAREPAGGQQAALHLHIAMQLHPRGRPLGIAHCSPELLGSSDPAGSASRVAGTTGVRHRARQRQQRRASHTALTRR